MNILLRYQGLTTVCIYIYSHAGVENMFWVFSLTQYNGDTIENPMFYLLHDYYIYIYNYIYIYIYVGSYSTVYDEMW